MKKHINLLSIFAILLAVATSCGGDEPAPDLPPPAETLPPRTILVYMAANNSLGGSGLDNLDLLEMMLAADAGDLGDSRLLVYHAARGKTPVLLEIDAESDHELKEYDPMVSSLAISRMKEVFDDMRTIAPAQHYGLVLWSHGSGWIQNGIAEPDYDDWGETPRSVLSFGDDGGKYMNVTSLASALDGQGFDYIYFDCCYMASVEVVYELRHVTDVIVGSATELGADGMPYDRTLRYLAPAEPDIRSACETTFELYDSLEGSDRTCTMSLIETAGLDELAAATRAIYATRPRMASGFKPQAFMTRNCVLFDLKHYINALDCDPAALERWNRAFDGVVKYKNQTPMLWNSISLENHNGLSTYILDDASMANNRNYYQLSWWGDVASALFY